VFNKAVTWTDEELTVFDIGVASNVDDEGKTEEGDSEEKEDEVVVVVVVGVLMGGAGSNEWVEGSA
jgi:hypothetical protein